VRSHGSTKTTKTKKSFQQFKREEEEDEKEKEKKDLSLISLVSRLFSSLSRCFFFTTFFFEKKVLSDVGIFFCLSRRVLVRVIFSLFLFSARGKRSSGRAKDARTQTQRDRERERYNAPARFLVLLFRRAIVKGK